VELYKVPYSPQLAREGNQMIVAIAIIIINNTRLTKLENYNEAILAANSQYKHNLIAPASLFICYGIIYRTTSAQLQSTVSCSSSAVVHQRA
jgi:hypothetical protein